MRQSGDSDPKLGITKEGDKMLRRYLVQAAHHILGRSKVDSDLRRFGESIMARDADHGRKRAVIAVARKLAVLMFHLLKSGKPYDPLHHQTRTNGEVAA